MDRLTDMQNKRNNELEKGFTNGQASGWRDVISQDTSKTVQKVNNRGTLKGQINIDEL